MLIWYSIIISYIYQCWKQFCWLLLNEKHSFIQDSFLIVDSKSHNLFENHLLLVNVFTVTFDQFNKSLHNKSIYSLRKNCLTPNLWTVVYALLAFHIIVTSSCIDYHLHCLLFPFIVLYMSVSFTLWMCHPCIITPHWESPLCMTSIW